MFVGVEGEGFLEGGSGERVFVSLVTVSLGYSCYELEVLKSRKNSGADVHKVYMFRLHSV